MPTLDMVISNVVKDVPECVAAGWVDMSTGMLLAAKTVDSHPQEVLDLVAAATCDIFQGSNVVAIEQMFKQARGVRDDGAHYFKEIIVFSENLLHFFGRGKRHTDSVLTIVCRKSANIGMVIAKGRANLIKVEQVA
jgi:hypothetical protein